MRALDIAQAPRRVRAPALSALLVGLIVVALVYIAVSLADTRPMQEAADLNTSLLSSRATHVEAPLAAAPADAPSRGPLRVFFVQPVPYESGLPIFRGYVRNDHSSDLSNLRMEITYADGAVATYPIVDALAPGEQASFEFRGRRADLSTQPKFLFSMSR